MNSRSRKLFVFVAAAAFAAAPLPLDFARGSLTASGRLMAVAAPQAKPAAKIDGNWDMTVTMADGSPMSVKAVFKSDGKKLTGSLTSPQGETPLEGEYADGKVAFGIAIDGPEGPMKIGFAGSLKDDGSLAGMASGPFGEIPWTAVKAK